MNSVTSFILQVLEMCVRSACASGLGYLSGSTVNLWSTNWHELLGLMAGAFIITLLTCFATQPFGDKTSPSLISHSYTFVPVPNAAQTVTVNTEPTTTTLTTPAPGTVPAVES